MIIISQIREALQSMFSQCAELANQEHRVIERVRKFNPHSLAQTFILAFLQNPQANSEEIAGMAASCGAPMTKQAIDKRFTQKAADFFEAVFRQATKLVVRSDRSLAPLLDRFTEVIVIDASSISLPDSQQDRFKGRGGSHGYGKSALKLQTELDLKRGGLACVDIEQGSDADVACARQTVARPTGSLRITDLGYFSISVFQSLANAGAYFLSRIQRITIVRDDGGRESNIVEYLRAQPSSLVDCWIEIGTKNRLKCRLIAWKVLPDQAAERRRKLRLAHKKRNRGEPCSEALAACDWTFLVTNLPAEKLTVKEAIVLYRARWQIELLFKRWKSLGLIASLNGKHDAEKMVRLWSRLCAALIQHWLTVLCGWREDLIISFARVAKAAKRIAEQLALGLSSDGSESLVERILQRFYDKTSCCARADKRTNRGAIELLRDPEKLGYTLS